jgi:hypothetical protein
MSWENLGNASGKWQINHTIPCAAFDMRNEADRLRCFHYKNLRPLWSHLNAVKGAIWNGCRLPAPKSDHDADAGSRPKRLNVLDSVAHVRKDTLRRRCNGGNTCGPTENGASSAASACFGKTDSRSRKR